MTALVITALLLAVATLSAQVLRLYGQREQVLDDNMAMTFDLAAAEGDALMLSRDLDKVIARNAELLDENQLLRDDALDAPVPFTVIHQVAHEVAGDLPKSLRLVVPKQRDGRLS